MRRIALFHSVLLTVALCALVNGACLAGIIKEEVDLFWGSGGVDLSPSVGIPTTSPL